MNPDDDVLALDGLLDPLPPVVAVAGLDDEVPIDPPPPQNSDALRLNYWRVNKSNLVAFLLMSYIHMNNEDPAILSPDLNFRQTKKEQVEEDGKDSLRHRLKAEGSYLRTVFTVYEAALLGYEQKGGAAARHFPERDVFTNITDKWNSGGDLEAIFPDESAVNRAIKLLDPDESIRKTLGDELLSNLPLTAVYCHVVSRWSSTTFFSWNKEDISAFIEKNFVEVNPNDLWFGKGLFEEEGRELPQGVGEFIQRAEEEGVFLLEALRLFVILNLAKVTKLVLCFSNGNHRLLAALYALLGLHHHGTEFKKIERNAGIIHKFIEKEATISLHYMPPSIDLLEALHDIANNSCNEAKEFGNNGWENLFGSTIPHFMRNALHRFYSKSGIKGSLSYSTLLDSFLELYSSDDYEDILREVGVDVDVDVDVEPEGEEDDKIERLRKKIERFRKLREEENFRGRVVLKLGKNKFWQLFRKILSKIFFEEGTADNGDDKRVLQPFINFWRGKLGDSFPYESSFRFLSLALHNLWLFHGLTVIHHQMADTQIRGAVENTLGWKSSISIEQLLNLHYDKGLQSLTLFPAFLEGVKFRGNLEAVRMYLKSTLQKCFKNQPSESKALGLEGTPSETSAGYSLYNVFLLCLIQPDCWTHFGKLISSFNGDGTKKIVEAVAATMCCLAAVVAHRISPTDAHFNQSKTDKQRNVAAESWAPYHSAITRIVVLPGGIFHVVVEQLIVNKDNTLDDFLPALQESDECSHPTCVEVLIGGQQKEIDIPIDCRQPLAAALILYLRRILNGLYVVTDRFGRSSRKLKLIFERIDRSLLGLDPDAELSSLTSAPTGPAFGFGVVGKAYPCVLRWKLFPTWSLSSDDLLYQLPMSMNDSDNDNDDLEQASNEANTEDEGGSSESGAKSLLFFGGSNDIEQDGGGSGDTTATAADSDVAVAVGKRRKGLLGGEDAAHNKRTKTKTTGTTRMMITIPPRCFVDLCEMVGGADTIENDKDRKNFEAMITTFRDDNPPIDSEANRSTIQMALMKQLKQWFKKNGKGVSSNNEDNNNDNSSQHQHDDEDRDSSYGSNNEDNNNEDNVSRHQNLGDNDEIEDSGSDDSSSSDHDDDSSDDDHSNSSNEVLNLDNSDNANAGADGNSTATYDPRDNADADCNSTATSLSMEISEFLNSFGNSTATNKEILNSCGVSVGSDDDDVVEGLLRRDDAVEALFGGDTTTTCTDQEKVLYADTDAAALASC